MEVQIQEVEVPGERLVFYHDKERLGEALGITKGRNLQLALIGAAAISAASSKSEEIANIMALEGVTLMEKVWMLVNLGRAWEQADRR